MLNTSLTRLLFAQGGLFVFLTALILCAFAGTVVGQKKSTIAGQLVIGEVSTIDEATGEITIKYVGKEGPEIFSGVLANGYKLKRNDGTSGELKINQIVGTHVRVFYKTDEENVAGQKRKVNKIVRLELLGKDEYVRLRTQLDIDPATVVAHAEDAELPARSPLKVYLSTAYGRVQESLADWINKWNSKHGETYGKLELVSDLGQADLLIVIAKGSDTMVAVFPFEAYKGDSVFRGEWSEATAYLAVKDAEGLKVLWTKVVPVLSDGKIAVAPRSNDLLASELEKRMKARAGKVKK